MKTDVLVTQLIILDVSSDSTKERTKSPTKSTRKQRQAEMARRYINYYVNPSSSSSDSDENVEEGECPNSPKAENAFKNDGSFLEMFKQMQENQQQTEIKTEVATMADTKPLPPPPLLLHQRRAGKILKTGMVQKRIEPQQPDENASSQVWNLYLREVKKYKEAICDDDSNRRALIK